MEGSKITIVKSSVGVLQMCILRTSNEAVFDFGKYNCNDPKPLANLVGGFFLNKCTVYKLFFEIAFIWRNKKCLYTCNKFI